MKILALSGIYNSEPEHWISRWQNDDSRFVKLDHSEWDRPVCSVWVSELESGSDRHYWYPYRMPMRRLFRLMQKGLAVSQWLHCHFLAWWFPVQMILTVQQTIWSAVQRLGVAVLSAWVRLDTLMREVVWVRGLVEKFCWKVLFR